MRLRRVWTLPLLLCAPSGRRLGMDCAVPQTLAEPLEITDLGEPIAHDETAFAPVLRRGVPGNAEKLHAPSALYVVSKPSFDTIDFVLPGRLVGMFERSNHGVHALHKQSNRMRLELDT